MIYLLQRTGPEKVAAYLNSFVAQLRKWIMCQNGVMLAAQYGIPQLRERIFIVATKKPNGFKFPDPT